jgi:hypothetical protein
MCPSPSTQNIGIIAKTCLFDSTNFYYIFIRNLTVSCEYNLVLFYEYINSIQTLLYIELKFNLKKQASPKEKLEYKSFYKYNFLYFSYSEYITK